VPEGTIVYGGWYMCNQPIKGKYLAVFSETDQVAVVEIMAYT